MRSAANHPQFGQHARSQVPRTNLDLTFFVLVDLVVSSWRVPPDVSHDGATDTRRARASKDDSLNAAAHPIIRNWVNRPALRFHARTLI
jgi:hypothetical protein